MKKVTIIIIILLVIISIGFVLYQLLGLGVCLGGPARKRNIFTKECKEFSNNCWSPWYSEDDTCHSYNLIPTIK